MLAGCSTNSDRRWVAYGGGEIDLECGVGASDQRKWWVRAGQEEGDCQWQLLDGCGANEHCEVGVDYSTTRNELEYCCTRDADPTASAANDVQCFSLGGELQYATHRLQPAFEYFVLSHLQYATHRLQHR